jgi:hypothetical protein
MAFNPTAVVQEINLDKDAFKLKTPMVMSIIGPSQCGKSFFIVKLVENRDTMFTCHFQRIIYCVPESLAHRNNPIFTKIKDSFSTAELVYGLPSISKLNLDLDTTSPSLVIIDDQMSEFLNSKEMLDLAIIKSHHFQINCIWSSHNMFCPSRFGKTQQRNVNYRVLFYNRMEKNELKIISLHLTPNFPSFLESNFEFLLEKFPEAKSHYLLIDGHFRSKIPMFFVRSNIFPDNLKKFRPIVFFPNSNLKK